MWMTVTPEDDTSPFTGSYTGGSLLPFILLSGTTYTITATESYGDLKFGYWKDNNSTDFSRTILLNENITLVAIYEQT
jgi:hypothetical protein